MEAERVEWIRREKDNPSGVVDLRRLHDWGEELAEFRELRKALQSERKKELRMFAKWSKVSKLDVEFCEVWYPAHRPSEAE